MKFVVDIDGTICSNTDGDYNKAVPDRMAIEKINALYNAGHIVVYFTARGMSRTNNNPKTADEMFRGLTERQLREWGCRYHQLIMGKPSGDYYIDDKGVNSVDFFR